MFSCSCCCVIISRALAFYGEWSEFEGKDSFIAVFKGVVCSVYRIEQFRSFFTPAFFYLNVVFTGEHTYRFYYCYLLIDNRVVLHDVERSANKSICLKGWITALTC